MTTALKYRGRLQVTDIGDLEVDLRVQGREMLLIASAGSLGVWPLSEVDVVRVGGEQFRLTLGEEQVTFFADDAIAFSYEGMPAIRQTTAFDRAKKSLRRARRQGTGLSSNGRAVQTKPDRLALVSNKPEAPIQRNWQVRTGEVQRLTAQAFASFTLAATRRTGSTIARTTRAIVLGASDWRRHIASTFQARTKAVGTTREVCEHCYYVSLAAAAREAHQATDGIGAVARASNGGLLETMTIQERELLLLIGQGLANQAIATQMGLSVTAIKRHRTSMIAKLDGFSVVEIAGREPPGHIRQSD